MPLEREPVHATSDFCLPQRARVHLMRLSGQDMMSERTPLDAESPLAHFEYRGSALHYRGIMHGFGIGQGQGETVPNNIGMSRSSRMRSIWWIVLSTYYYPCPFLGVCWTFAQVQGLVSTARPETEGANSLVSWRWTDLFRRLLSGLNLVPQ